MRKTISDLFGSIQKVIGTFNRFINAVDAVVEVGEANATSFRDEELKRLQAESKKRTKTVK